VDEGGVEGAGGVWGVVDEKGDVGVEQEEQEDALQDGGENKGLEDLEGCQGWEEENGERMDPGYRPRGHDPVCEYEGQAYSFYEGSLCVLISLEGSWGYQYGPLFLVYWRGRAGRSSRLGLQIWP
jgi:hypothetical protein